MVKALQYAIGLVKQSTPWPEVIINLHEILNIAIQYNIIETSCQREGLNGEDYALGLVKG